MPVLRGEEFTKLNLMAGTARALEQSDLSEEDRKIWGRDFALLCDELSELIDPELGKDLRDEKDFYTGACQVAKGYFNDKPFGGLKCSTGQYGFRFIIPQDMRTASGGGDGNQLYSWFQTVTTEDAKSTIYLWGCTSTTTTHLLGESESEHKNLLAFHRLLSYKPEPRIIMLSFTVNEYGYAPYAVELYSKIEKPDKLYKLIPMPGRIIIHPGGKLRAKAWVDRVFSGTTKWTGTVSLDIEVAPFGLTFAENDYLNIDDAIV